MPRYIQPLYIRTRYTLEETPLSAEEFKARIEKITVTYPFIVAKENARRVEHVISEEAFFRNKKLF